MARTKKPEENVEKTDEFLDGYKARKNGLPEVCPINEAEADRRKAWLLGYKRRDAEERESPPSKSPDNRPVEWREGRKAAVANEDAATNPYAVTSPKGKLWLAGWQHATDAGSSEAPPQTEYTLSDKDRVAGLNARGIAITIEQWRKLPNPALRMASKWLGDALAGKETQLPVCLLEFSAQHKAAVAAEISAANEVEIPVEFGSFSCPGESASIGVRIPKSVADHAAMEKTFCGKRLKAVLEPADPQAQLPGMEDMPADLPGIFESKGWGSKPSYFKVTLNVKCEGGIADRLLHFANSKGRLRILEVGTLSEKPDKKNQPAKNPPPPKRGPKKSARNEADSPRQPKQKPLADLAPAQDGRPADERPDVIRFPSVEKLFLCNQQCRASLALVGATDIPAGQVDAWNDEQRDEVDVWAKSVAAAAANGMSEVPETPAILKGLIPDAMFSGPVEYLQTDGIFAPRLSWYCHACETATEATGDVVENCPACQQCLVVLVGYYGEPRCNRDGEFYVLHTEQFAVPFRAGIDFRVLLSVVRGETGDRRFRCGLMAEHKLPGAAEWTCETSEPNIRDNGRATMSDAIGATIGKLMGAWQKLDGPEAAAAVDDLKTYLSQIERGTHPSALEPGDDAGEDEVTP